MKKVEYGDPVFLTPEQKRAELNADKSEDLALPEFSKEVPISSKLHPGEDTSVDYEWKNTASGILRIKRITFRKGEALTDFYRAPCEDGVDTACISHNNITYVIRKTTRDVSVSIYKAYGKMSAIIEKVVGYLRTVGGNDYLISRIEPDSWVFDKRISSNNVNILESERLDRQNKSTLCERIVEKISELHGTAMILGKFTLNNLLLTDKTLLFTDVRRLRLSRKKFFVVEEFKYLLQYLFNLGIASRDDVYFMSAYYVSKNQSICDEWYQEKTRKKVKDSFDVVSKLEEEVYN